MADAGVRGYHGEIGECLLRPAQQLIALGVAVELQLGVDPEGVGAAEDVGDHRVVDHQLGRAQRVDPLRVAAQGGDGVAHGDQVDHARHPGEVLHQHPGRGERHLAAVRGGGIPGHQGVDLFGGDQPAVLVAQQVLQQHLQAVGQSGDAVEAVQAMNAVADVVDGELIAGAETVADIGGHGDLRAGGEGWATFQRSPVPAPRHPVRAGQPCPTASSPGTVGSFTRGRPCGSPAPRS